MILKVIRILFLVLISSFIGIQDNNGSETQNPNARLALLNDSHTQSNSLNRTDTLNTGLYIVVGVFQVQKNAVTYRNYILSKGYQSKYGLRPDNGFFYVYLHHTTDWNEAVSEINEVRRDNELAEAWVLRVNMDQNTYTSLPISETPEEPEVFIEEEKITEKPIEKIEEPVKDNTKKEDIKGDYFLYLNSFNTANNKKVAANIQLVDNVRAKLIKKLKSHVTHGVWDPKNRTTGVKLICDVFGYRKLEHDIKLNNPINDSTRVFTKVNNDTILVDFKLERLKAGDIAVMYNVYFFNDAAIMRPQSKYEVNSLLEMMKENDQLKIVLHGHTNSNKAGKIIRLGEGQTNFFSVSKENVEGVGTAKDLSRERAELIKKYLISEGIAENRMSVKGWGGKKMLYDKDSSQAKKNIRVEVEIVKE